MELNLEREHLNCYDLVLDTCTEHEETLEVIVPDACQDIARIVDSGGQICLTGKNVHEDGVTVSGTVKAWVLYRPEEGGGVCRMEARIPFVVRADAPGVSGQGVCVAEPCLRGLDARALNPRKVLIRSDIGMLLQVYRPDVLAICQGIAGGEQDGVQQRTGQHMVYLTAAVQEKEFTFYDEVRLSAGPAGSAQLLSLRADACCNESKVIGNKLVFKGEAVLQLRYLVGGEVCAMRCPMPFSQIMEIEGVGENGDCDLAVSLTDVEYTLAGEDGRTLNVTLALLGQAVVRDQRPVTVLQDAYGTTQTLNARQEMCSLPQLVECATRPQNVRELLETEGAVKSVIDGAVVVSHMAQSREEGKLVLRADLRLNVLYLDEQNELRALNRMLSVSGHMDLPAQCTCRSRCRCSGEVFAVPSAGGVEVRFAPEFSCLVTKRKSVPAVTEIKQVEAVQTQQAQPSVVLRMAEPGEELWDIAKAYGTTCGRICAANGLEGQEVPAGRMLLIPGVR